MKELTEEQRKIVEAARKGKLGAIDSLYPLIYEGKVDEKYVDSIAKKVRKGSGAAMSYLYHLIKDSKVNEKYVDSIAKKVRKGKSRAISYLYDLIKDGKVDKKYADIIVEAAWKGHSSAIDRLYELIKDGIIAAPENYVAIIAKAARKGHSNAIILLYDWIKESKVDKKYADIIVKAAIRGNETAIGRLYELINYGKVDKKYADIIVKAARRGNETAIGRLYQSIGWGHIDKKYVEIIAKAARKGKPRAMKYLYDLINDGKVDKKYADIIVEAAKGDEGVAISYLYHLINDGKVDKKYADIIVEAARRGNETAIMYVYAFLIKGGIIAKKYADIIIEAAEGGSGAAIGRLYGLIEGGEIDKKYGNIIVEDARRGNAAAIDYLYDLINEGKVDKKYADSIVEAAEGGNETAIRRLYDLIDDGKVDKKYAEIIVEAARGGNAVAIDRLYDLINKGIIDKKYVSLTIENEKLSIYVNNFEGDLFKKVLRSSKTLSDQKNPEFEKFISIIPDQGLYSKRNPHALINFIDYLNEGLPLFEVICLNSEITPEQLSKDSTEDFAKHIGDLLGTDSKQFIKEANKKIKIYMQKTATDNFDLTEEQANQLVNSQGIKKEHKGNIKIFNKLHEHWNNHSEEHYTRSGILGKLFCSVLSKDHEIEKTREKYFHSEKDGFYNFKFSELEKLEREHGLTSKEAKRWKEHIRLIRKPKGNIFDVSTLISAMNEVKLHVDDKHSEKLLGIFTMIENNISEEEPEQPKDFSKYYRNLKNNITNAISQLKSESEKEENKEIKSQLVETKIKFEHIFNKIPENAVNNYLTITDYLTLEQNMRMGEYPTANCHHWNAKKSNLSYRFNRTLASFVADATKRTIYVSRKGQVLGRGFLYLVKDKKDGKWKIVLDSVAGSNEAQKYVRWLAFLKANRLFGTRKTSRGYLVIGLESIEFESWGKVPELYSDSTGHAEQNELSY